MSPDERCIVNDCVFILSSAGAKMYVSLPSVYLDEKSVSGNPLLMCILLTGEDAGGEASFQRERVQAEPERHRPRFGHGEINVTTESELGKT